MTRCTGHCCVGFYCDLDVLTDPARNIQDGDQIRAMLIETDNPTRFNCKHHLSSGDCGIYASRPRMCSGYPYGGSCERDGCTAAPTVEILPLP